MPGLVPGIRVFLCGGDKNVDGRDEPGHDNGDEVRRARTHSAASGPRKTRGSGKNMSSSAVVMVSTFTA